MVFFGFVILAAYGLMVRKYVLAHACMLFLFVTKLYFMFATLIHNSNYEYYHTLFCMVFVFLPRKRFFGSLMVVWCYFLSTAAKIHPTWVWGSYFSSLETGLPLAPSGWEPLFTNFVIFMEMVMSWFMFSSRKWLQRSVFAFFVFFHLYSGILVGYRYPVIVMPSLLIFFGSLFRPFPSIPLNRASLPGWILIVSMLVIQMYNHTLPSDPKLTLEGDYYGLFMFEANHQCRIAFADEQGRTLYSHDYISARHRCDPWVELTAAQQKFCKYAPQSKIKFTEIHSINGGPFYEIVNEPDLCSLNYKPFADNVWIKDETTASMVGRPLKNIYW
jgi:hypothetical protein